MPPAPRTPLVDQVTAAAIMARLDGFEGYLDAVAKDAREARDATLILTSKLNAEDTQQQLVRIWARIEANENAWRSDLVNSVSREATTRSDADAKLQVEIDGLKEWRQRLEGANGLVRWVSKYAPWLLTVFISGLALFGKKFLP